MSLDAWVALDPDAIAGLDPRGDLLKRELLGPALLRHLPPLPGARILDAGCGHGWFSRLLAGHGARVTAIEPSPALADYVAGREAEQPLGIQLVRADLSDLDLRESISDGSAGFDAVVAALVFCTIDDWTAALHTCLAALRSGGRLVLAVEHPCFAQGLPDWSGSGIAETTRYLRPYQLPGAIAPEYYRPLSAYVCALLAAGATITAIDEPGLDPALAATDRGLRPFVELPPFLVVAATFTRRG